MGERKKSVSGESGQKLWSRFFSKSKLFVVDTASLFTHKKCHKENSVWSRLDVLTPSHFFQKDFLACISLGIMWFFFEDQN